ncbi:transglutaminase [Hylemonella gracilis str. Niagara R]|uniref:Transglutaminase n=1 Tax=Hylemonella gracilis str. Niagara R TaxID=1458275 RepID=A0A016XHW2_9BURK|nr:transglutaminase domain-containing protein [Hylemonella gracilis]EYC51679.1 transglutaminase [Hylemonella gracilis str. Niagara R]
MTTVQRASEGRASQRRAFLKNVAAAASCATTASVLGTWPIRAGAQSATPERQFNPQPGAWRSFEVKTRVDVQLAEGQTRVWLPVPSIDSDWQRSLDNRWDSNGRVTLSKDVAQGGVPATQWLTVEFAPGEKTPWVELTSRVQTRSRAVDWSAKSSQTQDKDLAFWTRPTALLPTDGIVRETALKATQGAKTDYEKVRAVYDWVVTNAYREPKVRGCGEGDIKTMLETGNLGGKCADINALFVGLCRAVGLPARDVYGLRLAPSAFGYKELGGNNMGNLSGAQHCRAEVYLKDHGWVAMDPADVAKVMRQETPEWIKTTHNPLVAPVNKALFGQWEGNWVGWNMAHDLQLPGAQRGPLGFLMYPVCETGKPGQIERLDSYTPDAFKYHITAREI